jgi:hypothetical protein
MRRIHRTIKNFSMVRIEIWCYHNVSVDFKHTGQKAVVHLNEAQDRDELRALLNAVMNLGCVKKEESS